MAESYTKIDQLAAEDKFSGSILVTKDGHPIMSKSVGFANRKQQILNRLDTKFNLGSMNKMFTAVAIAQLAQQGKLKLHDPLGKYIPDYPNPDVAQVTIHQLLFHTGGTGDIFGPDFEVNIEKLKEPKDYIVLYGHRSLAFPPGSRFQYSNYGFVLLGAIIEQVSQQSYYAYIREQIYQLAGMTSSDSFWKTEETPNFAIGYTRLDGAGLTNNYRSLPMRGSPAGGGYSTVEDLMHFAHALLSHQLLSAAYTDLLTTANVVKKESNHYIFGFKHRFENGVDWFGHSGGAPGMNATLRIYPASGYIIAVMGNLDPPAADSVADLIGKVDR